MFVGIVVFLSISFVNTPPIVSIPSESGVTSSRRTPVSSPPSTPACLAAPTATHSSGLIPLLGSLPISFLTASCTAGILEEPPTRRTSSICDALRPASFIAFLIHVSVLATRSAVSSSNLAFVSVISICFGPVASAVMNGRLMFEVVVVESSIFDFSAASFNLCIAILSVERSTPSVFLNSSSK